MQRKCRVTGAEFHIEDLEQDLCARLEVPLPTLHPKERMRKLMSFNNYPILFKGVCAGTGDNILQVYGPEAPFPVYCSEYWWSDAWDPMDYGRAYDFSKLFFPQLNALKNCVPQHGLSVNYTSLENCDYINGASYCKNSYLIFHAAHNEDCFFCYTIWRSRDCVDCTVAYDCELCYDGTFVKNCYNLRHSFNCKTCRDSSFLWNCIGCHDCFGCVNLRQKSFCYYNEQLSEAQYRDRIANIEFDNYEAMQALENDFMRFAETQPQPAVHGVSLDNSSGDFINNCSNASNCFNCAELEDCVNCFGVEAATDCMDYYSWGEKCELVYNTTRCGYSSSNIKFCNIVYLNSSDMEYCINCQNCKDCFGCVGLRNKRYCVLNQQYTRDEYFDLKARIINQMKDPKISKGDDAYGEYLPYYLSLFPFNASDAMRYFPISKEEALARNIEWKETKDQQVSASIDWDALPKRSQDAEDSISKETFICDKSGRPFRISARELNLYKKMTLPLPRQHWESRMAKRRALFNKPELHQAKCEKTGVELLTSYPPDSSWRVWDYDVFAEEFAK